MIKKIICIMLISVWQSTMCGYEVSDEGRALATIPGSTRPVMCSSGSTFQCGHSIIFRVQKCGESCEADAIGLCLHGSPADLKQKGVLFVSSDGMWILVALHIHM